MSTERNVIIIGAGSTIAKELIHLLNQEDINVYATSRKQINTDTIQFKNFLILNPIQPDMEQWKSFLPDEIHGLIYFPGSITLKPFHSIKTEQFLEDLQINFLAAIPLIQAALNPLKKSGSASVVFFSSVAASTGFSYHASISAAKGAVEAFSRSLAAEYASIPIRFNCIAPSLTITPLAGRLVNSEKAIEQNASRHPISRLGTPQEIAAAAHFLLSENSSWITGQVLHVDGGISVINK